MDLAARKWTLPTFTPGLKFICPGAGWVGLDALPVSLRRRTSAAGGHAEPQAAAPISGGVDECQTEFDVKMSVQRIHEDPRVTYPYSDEAWQQNDELGLQDRCGVSKRRCPP